MELLKDVSITHLVIILVILVAPIVVVITSISMPANKPRSLGTAYVLLLLFGFFGAHKFYLQKVGFGVLYLMTSGLFTIGLLFDLFTLPAQVRRFNERLAASTVRHAEEDKAI